MTSKRYNCRVSGMLGAVLLSLVASTPGRGANYLGPTAVAVSPRGTDLYVACLDGRQVLRIALDTGETVQRIPMPAPPTGLVFTPNGQRLVVTCASERSYLVVLDAVTGRMEQTYRTGHFAMSPVVAPDNKRVYLCDRFDHRVTVLDIDNGALIRQLPVVREPVAAALSADGRWLVVANHLPLMRTNIDILGDVQPVVSLIDTDRWSVRSILLSNGANGLRDVCVTPDGRYALVTHLLSNFQEVPFRIETGWINTNVVSVIDLHDGKVTGTIGLDEMDLGAANPWGITCTADGRYVAAALSGTHEVAVIDRRLLVSAEARRMMSPMMGVWPIYVSLGRSYWQRVTLTGNGPRAIASHGDKVYVANYFSDTVDVVDLVSPPTWRWTIHLGPTPQLTSQRRGEQLFHDATICYQHWQSCSSCHPDGRVDGLSWDLVNDGQGNAKNTKSLVLAHRTPPAMSVGVRESAEQAVRSGLLHILFTQRPESDAAAIDDYLRSLRPLPSPHLRDGRLSAAAARGRELFMSKTTGCIRCHPPPLYTDCRQHDVGTRSTRDRHADFDTPTLVEIWRTAPYMHDGRYLTVDELLKDGHHGLTRKARNQLTPRQWSDLVEFVLSL